MIEINEKTAAELVMIMENNITRYRRLNEEMAMRGATVNYNRELETLKRLISELTNTKKPAQ